MKDQDQSIRDLIKQRDEMRDLLLIAVSYIEDVIDDPEQLRCFKKGVPQGHARRIHAAIAKSEGKAGAA